MTQNQPIRFYYRRCELLVLTHTKLKLLACLYRYICLMAILLKYEYSYDFMYLFFYYFNLFAQTSIFLGIRIHDCIVVNKNGGNYKNDFNEINRPFF